jgi:hypothetical protein
VKKIAQNVAQPILVNSDIQLLPWIKVAQKIIVIKKTAQRSPNRRTFAQSGHPGRHAITGRSEMGEDTYDRLQQGDQMSLLKNGPKCSTTHF